MWVTKTSLYSILSAIYLRLYFFIFLNFTYLFWRERVHGSTSGGRNRGRMRERISSRLRTEQGAQPRLSLMTLGSRPELKPTVGHLTDWVTLAHLPCLFPNSPFKHTISPTPSLESRRYISCSFTTYTPSSVYFLRTWLLPLPQSQSNYQIQDNILIQ